MRKSVVSSGLRFRSVGRFGYWDQIISIIGLGVLHILFPVFEVSLVLKVSVRCFMNATGQLCPCSSTIKPTSSAAAVWLINRTSLLPIRDEKILFGRRLRGARPRRLDEWWFLCLPTDLWFRLLSGPDGWMDD